MAPKHHPTPLSGGDRTCAISSVTPSRSQDRNVAGRTRKAGASGGWSPGGLRVGARPRAQADGRVPEDDRRHHDSERSHGAARGRASSTEGAAVVASACRVTSSYRSRQWRPGNRDPERMGALLRQVIGLRQANTPIRRQKGDCVTPKRCAARNPQGLEVKANDRVVR